MVIATILQEACW